MSENPYQAPQADTRVVGVKSGRREDLKSVAIYQKGILVCILVYIIVFMCQFVLPSESRVMVNVGLLLDTVVGTVFVFLLAMKVYNTGIGILTLVPCIGLLVLLAVNGKATGVLKQNGIKVGLLGADVSQL